MKDRISSPSPFPRRSVKSAPPGPAMDRTLSDAIMPFGEHLEELRRRLIYALLGIAPIFVLSLLVGKPIVLFLMEPAREALRAADLPSKFQQTGVLEFFYAYMRISFIITILVGSPWVLWQLWLFVSPGLYPNERRFAYLLAPFSILLTVIGVAFMYYVMLPVVLAFFVNFGSVGLPGESAARTAPLAPGIVLPQTPVLEADPPDPQPGEMWINGPLKEMRVAVRERDGAPLVLTIPLVGTGPVMQQYRVSEYVSMILSFALAFAVAFQMPVVVLLLGWAGIIQPAVLTRYRRHAIMVCAVLGAVLTPADPISMLLLAGPLYGLYELGVVMLGLLPAERVAAGFDFWGRKRRRSLADHPPRIDADAGDGGGP